MAFYRDNTLENSTHVLTLEDTEVGFFDYLGAAFGDAVADNPTHALYQSMQMNGKLYGADEISNLVAQAEDGGLTGFADNAEPLQTRSPLTADEQKERIQARGLEKYVTPQDGYNAAALDFVMDLKQEELDRALTRRQAPEWMAPAGFAAGLGASMLDPINLASLFLPVMGEQRVLSMLSHAGGAWGRAAVRAGVGAVEGAVGAAALEPIVYSARNQVQADYGMTDALLNIAFGTVMGGAMHTATGAWGDWLRQRRGQRQPWEIVTPNDATEQLRADFEGRLFTAAQEAGGNVSREQAQAAAILFDARARTWAYDTGQNPEAYYQRWAPDFRAGTEGAEGLAQGASLPDRFASLPSVQAEGVDTFGQLTEAHMETPESRKALRTSVKEWARKNFTIDTQIANTETGWNVFVTPSGIDHTLSHGFDVLLAKSVPSIPQLVKTGMFLTSIEKKPGLMSHFFANKLRLDGQDYVVGFVLREDGNGNRFYDHEMTEIINPERLVPGKQQSSVAEHRTNRGDVINILREHLGVNDGTAKVLFQDDPRARVLFGAGEEGRAVIEFFKSADVTSAPHELYHIFRRELEATAMAGEGGGRSRDLWEKVRAFVGEEEGQPWTREMEEKFARAGERFLLEGRAPAPALEGVFARLRQWFTEIYTGAEVAGMEVSDAMRRVFGDMLSLSAEESDMAFRYTMGKALEWEPLQDVDTRIPDAPDMSTPEAVARVSDELDTLAQEHFNEALERLQDFPEAVREVGAEAEQLLTELDAAMARDKIMGEALLDAARCDMRS